MVIIPSQYDIDEKLKEQKEAYLITSLEDYMALIRKHIFPKLALAEEKRKTLKKMIYLLHGITVIGLITCVYFTYQAYLSNTKFWDLFYLLALIPSLIAWVKGEEFIKQQKNDFLTNLLDFIGAFEKGQDTITADFLNNSALFPNIVCQEGREKLSFFSQCRAGLLKHFCPVQIDEAFKGHYKNTLFSVAETLLKYTKRSRKHRRTVSVFKGVMIAIKLQKEINSQSVIYNEFLTFKQAFSDLEKVELEDDEFMKEYNIYSTNQMEVRFILTPRFIERLKKMKQAFQTKRIDMAIFENHLLLCLHVNKNMFEPFSVFKSLYNMRPYVRFYNEMKSVTQLIDVLQIENDKERMQFKNYF